MAELSASMIENLRWRIGIPADFWIVKEAAIGEFIKANKIKPVAHESLRVDAKPTVGTGKAVSIDYIINIRGGRKTPHLHYKGELYLLDAKQWQTFAAPVMKELSKQIAGANAISFDNLLDVAEAASALH
ncbi:hypothetical protein [Chlorobaculum limnaeum]|nr:hypothetical protein [Chlorobaculum limnaeum]